MTPVMANYIRPEVLAWAAFIFMLALAFGGALLAVLPKNIIHNVFGLATSLVGVAGLFIYLGSEFLAMMELLIYIGAICVAIVFAIMLSQPMHVQIPRRWRPKLALSMAVSVCLFVSLGVIVTRTDWEAALVRTNDWSVERLGTLLITRYELVFELISLVLLVAILGAIITAAAISGPQTGGQTPEEDER